MKLVELSYDRVLRNDPDNEEAILFAFDNRMEWIPRSQIHDYTGDLLDTAEAFFASEGDEVENGPGQIVVPEWLAVSKGLDDYAEEIG